MSAYSPERQPDNHASPHTITLTLNDIHDLFASTRLNPFQEDYLPLSGIDQITLQLRQARLHNGLHVTFVLPAHRADEAAQMGEIQEAIKRYASARLEFLMLDLKARQLTVIRSLEIGLVILAGSLAVGAAITRAEGMSEAIRNLLSNAVSIFGSVALWSPTDTFLFGMRPLYKEVRIYRAIRDMTFDVQYEKRDLTSLAASKVM